MALNLFTPTYAAAQPTFAAPTTNEVVTPGPLKMLVVKVGVTSTTMTIVTPGLLYDGSAVPDKVYGPATSTEWWVRLDSNYAAPDGTANVTFNQVTNVTACIINSPT